MKAMAAPGYGPLENLAQIELPLPTPGAGEVRVRVVASALNPADYKVVLGVIKFLHGRQMPLVVGYDFSGTVDAVGPQVTDIAVGDDVFGFLPYGPFNNRGAFAEMLIAKSSEIARKPAGISHEIAAAAATGGLTALQSIRNLGHLPASGGSVLVTGVSGGVGSVAVGIAQKLNATVTAVGSGSGLEMATRLGATDVIDRTTAKLPADLKAKYDVIFDAAAAYTWGSWRGALKPGGVFVTTLPSMAFATDKFTSLFSNTSVQFVAVKSVAADLNLLATWLEQGLQVPLTDTIPVRDVVKGLASLHKSGGRYAVRVADGF